MDYSKLFYWLVVADNARDFFLCGVVIFMIISVAATIAYFCNTDDCVENGCGGHTLSVYSFGSY